MDFSIATAGLANAVILDCTQIGYDEDCGWLTDLLHELIQIGLEDKADYKPRIAFNFGLISERKNWSIM